MASGHNDRPSPSGSSAFSASTRDQSPAQPTPNHHASVGSSIAGDGDDYDNNELQLILDTVIRAQEVLPHLPPTSQHPTNALFLAYEEILEERGIDPVDGQKLDKVLFKIGGSRNGDTIAEKFQAVMARMDITVRLDVSGVDGNGSPSGSTEDGYSSCSDLYDFDDSNEPPGPTEDKGILRHGDQDHERHPNDTDSPPHHLSNCHPEIEAPGRAANANQRYDIVLEKSVLGFERLCNRTHISKALQRWQDKSTEITDKVNLFRDAREADFEVDFHNVVVAWNEIAMEVDEMPLDDVPVNVYSKRIETIAARTHDIYASKNALRRWRQCTRERWRREETPPEELAGSDHDVNLRLSRLAMRAHENLMKSRMFTQWSNRAMEEEKKTHLAAMAHEMGLKSRALGLRPKLDMLASALRQRLQDRADRPVDISGDSIPELEAEPPSGPLQRQHEAPKQAMSEPAKALVQSMMKTSRTSAPAQSQTIKPPREPVPTPPEPAGSVDVPSEEDEQEDERTMLARRHILRMRFFRSWEDYTQSHRTRVTDFALQKALDPWRTRSSSLSKIALDSSQSHDNCLAKDALRRWAGAASHSDDQRAIAEGTRHRNQIIGAMKPWLAVARSRRRTLQAQRRVLAQWYFSQDQHEDLAMAAANFQRHRCLRITLSDWRIATRNAIAKKQELRGYAHGADYYRSIYGTMLEWRARAKENETQLSMKREALETWRDACKKALPRQLQMEHNAKRANFYFSVTQILPAWRDAAREAVERQGDLQERGGRMEYDSQAKETVLVWRAMAKEKRKLRLKDAHLEVRRMVKKGMGARCIAQWRSKLETSYARFEEMNNTLEGITGDQEWNVTAQAFDTWRLRAQEGVQMGLMSDAMVKQKVVEDWREQSTERLGLRAEAEEHRQDRATSRALKDWKLSSIQMESRRSTVEKHLNKDRRLLKHRFEGWYGKTADKLVPTQFSDGSYRSVENMVQDAQSQASQTRAKGLLSAWRAATRGEETPQPQDGEGEEEEEEDAVYAPTPGRPQLLLGSLGRRQTTTPLAPIPQRQPWQAGAGPADSILGRSAPGGTASRSGRSRRNLRVSWAE
ncbi:hypothetical protein BJ170DRAFT_60738 [Xylariales sp. AK1849]|nr:hypothetical protein BJ170DRAFT_60738 [Xylariales sp. AK1849]